MKLSWKQKVDCTLTNIPCENLNDECECNVVADESDNLFCTINRKGAIGNYSWDGIKIEKSLENLPICDTGCRFCPKQYECPTVAKAVEYYEKENISPDNTWEDEFINTFN